MRRQRGFTLIEVMTVVAILGIMVTLAVGGLEPMVQRLRAQQAADQVAEALAFAQVQARATNRCTAVDLIAPAAPGPTNALPAVAPGTRGTVARVWRWNDVVCAGAPSALNATVVQTLPLPSDTGAWFSVATAQVWLGNGRSRGAPDDVLVGALAGGPAAQRVVITPQGAVCPGSASGSMGCP